jgi:dTDP-4-amino-4,6-dideoxygalactose transaminase
MGLRMQIPFVDLKAQLKDIRQDVLSAAANVIDKCNFILGEDVKLFEQEFASYCGSRYAIGVANGTDALHLALRAAGVGPGDEVLVPANTFIATALGATFAGAKPVVVDVDPKTYLMDAEKAARAVTSRTKAILPVHLYGRMMDLTPLEKLARDRGLVLIEDAAQAHGATLAGRRAGTVGAMGCFSFYPGKNLGCAGDGGLVVTNREDLRDKLEALRNYGSPKKYHHPVLGTNSRLDTLQAAILRVKLPKLDNYNQRRYAAARKYGEALRGVGDLVLPEIPAEGSHVFHLYVVRTAKRDALLEHLNKAGVGAGIHYPVPIHLHGAYQDLGYRRGDFPVAEQQADEILSLPIFPELTDAQVDYVAKSVREFFS